MRKLILFSVVVLTVVGLSFSHNAFSSTETAEKPDHACVKCHQVSSEEVQKLLQPHYPDLKVIEVRPSQIKGLQEVAVLSKGQKSILYIDSAKKYLVAGSVLDVPTMTNLTKERYIELTKVDVSKIPLEDALVLGDKDAKYRVIVFDDPD